MISKKNFAIRDIPDSRDYKYISNRISLPDQYDLRTKISKPISILYQGDLGSCTSCQISSALRFCHIKNSSKNNIVINSRYTNVNNEQFILDFQPSILFIYYFGRLISGYNPMDEDTGLSIRAGLKVISKYGVPPERFHPYIIENFKDKPNDRAIKEALKYKLSFEYLSVSQDIESIKNAIIDGNPVILLIVMYESFTNEEILRTGIIPIPNIETEKLIGYHTVSLYGWNDNTNHFIMMNTWSDQYGDNGWFYLPYEFVTNTKLAFDLWTIKYFY